MQYHGMYSIFDDPAEDYYAYGKSTQDLDLLRAPWVWPGFDTIVSNTQDRLSDMALWHIMNNNLHKIPGTVNPMDVALAVNQNDIMLIDACNSYEKLVNIESPTANQWFSRRCWSRRIWHIVWDAYIASCA